MAKKQLTSLTAEQEARFPEWVEHWTAVGLSTERADMARFEPAVRACYRYAGLAEPKTIVLVPSPLAMALAGPMAGAILGGGAVSGAVGGAVGVAVDGAVSGAVGDAVVGAVGGAVGGLPPSAMREAIRRDWYRYIGGQFWVGGWWWLGSPSVVSYFREVCGLTLPDDLMDRALAYQATAESACWWWPHRDFVMVSDRPLHIRRDDRGRLHSESGPAIVWPDGFGVWSWHGVRVDAEVIDTPAEAITAERITGERNAEVRRVLIERVGAERYVAMMGATKVATDDWGSLWQAERKGDDPYLAVELLNSTPEPDGTTKTYWIRVPGTTERTDPDRCVVCDTDLAIVPTTPHQAVAWGYSVCTDHYQPVVMS